MKNKVYCCVPYCETGLRSDTEELKLFTTNRKELQKKWARAIQRPNYKFTKHSAVCILHFHKDDVLKGRMLFTYGKEVFIPYKVWKLKEGAIPEIFPDCSSSPHLNQALVKRKKLPDPTDTCLVPFKKIKLLEKQIKKEYSPLDKTIGCDTPYKCLASIKNEPHEDWEFNWSEAVKNISLPSGWVLQTYSDELQKYGFFKFNYKNGKLSVEKGIEIENTTLSFFAWGKLLPDGCNLPKTVETVEALREAIDLFDRTNLTSFVDAKTKAMCIY